jgi:hypothetical protein
MTDPLRRWPDPRLVTGDCGCSPGLISLHNVIVTWHCRECGMPRIWVRGPAVRLFAALALTSSGLPGGENG